MSTNNIIELAARVAQARPHIAPVEISKALVKLQKLAATLRSRAKVNGADPEHKQKSEMFFVKACELSYGIGCEFEASGGTPGHPEFSLLFDNRRERFD